MKPNLEVTAFLILMSSLPCWGRKARNSDPIWLFSFLECSITATSPDGISTKEGSPAKLACTRTKKNFALCGVFEPKDGGGFEEQPKDYEKYSVEHDRDGLIALKSLSGNVVIMGHVGNAYSSIASSHVVPEIWGVNDQSLQRFSTNPEKVGM